MPYIVVSDQRLGSMRVLTAVESWFEYLGGRVFCDASHTGSLRLPMQRGSTALSIAKFYNHADIVSLFEQVVRGALV